MLDTPLRRLRAIAHLEGLSFLVLLFVAMPLKYVFEMPFATRIVGSAHGALFVLFGFALLSASQERDWSIVRAAKLFGLSLIPFGNFVIDRDLKAEEERASAESIEASEANAAEGA